MKLLKNSFVVYWILACFSSVLYLSLSGFYLSVNKFFIQAIFLVDWLLIFILTIMLVIKCFKRWKGKWSLIFLVLIGVSNIRLNWLTGDIKLSIYSILVLPAQLSYHLKDSSLNMTLSFPIGALILLTNIYFKQRSEHKN